MTRFIDWYAKNPFENTIIILVLLSMTSCTFHEMAATWGLV